VQNQDPGGYRRKEALMTSRGTQRFVTVCAAAGLFVASGLSGAAQDATPAGGTGHVHPAHIHLGTCDALDPNPTFPLTDVALTADVSGNEADNNAAIPVERSQTTVDATLEDLRTGGYAINIHQSVEDIGTYIACGNLSGASDDSGDLVVGLGELNDSAHSGIAILHANGEQTDVNVYLTEGLSGTTASTAGTTGKEQATADATMVDIKDLAFNPAQIEIPVGGTVTWTNSDTVPHTATAPDRQLLQSGTLNPGDTFSQTFDTPGTIDYFCEFHPNMKGTIVVQ
jgi:plastocyanin